MLEPAEEEGDVSYIAEYPGANPRGETKEEAADTALEALAELLEPARQETLARIAPRAELLVA